MREFVIIFLFIATIFALATLASVAVDVILERKRKKKEEIVSEPEIPEEPTPVVVPVIIPAEESEPESETPDEPTPVVVPVIVPAEESEPEPETQDEPTPVVVPVVIPVEEPEVMPEIVEEIVAEEADEMISDDLAMQTANYEEGAGEGREGIINVGKLDENFEANDTVTLAQLKDRCLVSRKIGRLKILADGTLTKPLTVKAESYSIQAIKMIELTGGTVIILKDKKD